MKVSELKKQYKEYTKPRGRIAKATHHLPSIFHRPSPVVREIKAFIKSLNDNPIHERDLTLQEEYALGKILFAQRTKKDVPNREDFGFVCHIRVMLWGFDANNVFEGLKLLQENNMLDDKSAERIRNSHNCMATAEQIIGINRHQQL